MENDLTMDIEALSISEMTPEVSNILISREYSLTMALEATLLSMLSS